MPILTVRENAKPITGFQVLGERCSGTNFAKLNLKRNLRISPVEDFGWKHGFPHAIAYPTNILFVIVVRNALSWAQSMFDKPWHSGEALQRLGFSEFVRASWNSEIDRHDYFGLPKGSPLLGERLQHDRHPITGKAFENILAMRNVKMAAFLGMANRCENLLVVRHERFAEAPEEVVQTIRQSFDVDGPVDFRGIHRRLGSRFAPVVENRAVRTAEINAKDRLHILSELDLTQEALLGYHY